jgi:hypothetical protein
MFWWSVAITFLLGLATFCWVFSIAVFKYPEKPFNYRLLTKLKKLDPLAEFDPLSVPRGGFLSTKELLSKYYYLNGEQLRVKNDLLKRAYILNYKEETPDYIKGTFNVVQTRKLTEKDLMSDGWVVRGRSVELEDVDVELLLPGASGDASPYQEGQSFTLDNKSTFAALVHVERNSSDGVCASVVPIVYGENLTNGDRKIALEAPDKLNMEARLPATDPSAPGVAGATKVASQEAH